MGGCSDQSCQLANKVAKPSRRCPGKLPPDVIGGASLSLTRQGSGAGLHKVVRGLSDLTRSHRRALAVAWIACYSANGAGCGSVALSVMCSSRHC